MKYFKQITIFLGAPPSEQDTLEFELKVKCTKNNNASIKATELSELYKNHSGPSIFVNWELKLCLTVLFSL